MKTAIDKEGNTYLLRKSEAQTRHGVIKDIGESSFTNSQGNTFSLFEPTFIDLWKKLKRGPQAFTLKDIGFVLAYTGIGPGWKVVEAGGGSGALTLFLAQAVSPKGRIIVYDRRQEFLDINKQNVSFAGFDKVVKHKLKDVYDGFKEKNIDMVMLDLAEPWHVFSSAEAALNVGGFLVCYIPSFEQLRKCTDWMQDYKFSKPYVTELIEREILVKERSTRPDNRALSHTGYLIFSRRLA